MSQSSQIDAAARRRARRVLVQLLYQWQLTGDGLDSLLQQFREEVVHKQADQEYFDELVTIIMNHMASLDETIGAHTDRPIDEVTQVEKAVLRLAIAELEHRLDIPYRVVINEALELNKRFGTQEGHRFVNAVLDSVAKQYRSAELG